MVLFTVEEYPNAIQNDIEEMKRQEYSEDQIIDFMEDLKRALDDKIKELEG